MSKEKFVEEVERRILKIFRASREGYKASAVERHHLEGFIQAGVFLGLSTNAEMKQLMDKLHYSVFGKTIREHRHSKPMEWSEELIDYSQYDKPVKMRE